MKTLSKVTIGCLLIGFAVVFIASDHMDAPVGGSLPEDVTDLYAFEGDDPDNLVFAVTLQGLLSPEATQLASFDEDVMIEINIDNTGDNVEDLVIQMIPINGFMFFFGPVAPSQTGTLSTIETGGLFGKVKISNTRKTLITNINGIKYFAGPREDPFFFDAGQFMAIATGAATGFNDPGTDFFAGTNAMGITIELPKSLLGGNDEINTWVETKVFRNNY